jgi:hypothetical protein
MPSVYFSLDMESWDLGKGSKGAVRTTGEESIFGEDCYRVDEEDGDCRK